MSGEAAATPEAAREAADRAARADELVAAWLAAPEGGRASAWTRARALPALALAWALRRACDALWSTEPARLQDIAHGMDALSAEDAQPELRALAAWIRGLALLAQGQVEAALAQLEAADARFTALAQPLQAARTRVSRLAALAMLGRYEDALRCGEEARACFDAAADAQAAGRIELNLGTLATRRDRLAEALGHYERARQRFAAAQDAEREIACLKGMADVHARRHAFDAAEALYAQARTQAEAAGLALMVNLIDTELGMQEMRRGRFERALQRLEQARRGYAALALPHYLALAEEKLAEAYLELNLLPEALALFERSLAAYADAGLVDEQARTLAQRGRALALLGRYAAAAQALAQAQAAFEARANPVAAALVQTWAAEMALERGEHALAAQQAQAAQAPLQAAHHASGWLHALTLQAQALHASGANAQAQVLAHTALAHADALRLAPAQRRLQHLLGLLARDAGAIDEARRCFEAAVESIESQRGLLPGEEFRAAFLGHHLLPYQELARASLQGLEDGGAQAAASCLRWLERARARSLADAMADAQADAPVAATSPADGAAPPSDAARAASPGDEALRRQLDDCYRALSRPPGAVDAPDRAQASALLQRVQQLEDALLEAERRRVQGGDAPAPQAGRAAALDLDALYAALGAHSALVAYFSLDDRLHACTVVDGGCEVIALPVGLDEACRMVEALRFQIDTLRHGAARLEHRMAELQARTRHHLQRLHAALWAPLAARLGGRRVVVVPHGVLHYLPFAALHDGQAYEIERRELCRAPSAALLLRGLALDRSRGGAAGRALVIGHGDARLPQIEAELQAVASRFAQARLLCGDEARAAALREGAAAEVDVLHIACHAQFRHDSPRFSALHLADGAFTVRDAARLRLRARLVTLSACETGVSAVMPGDELIGLTQAFVSAGAARVLASLWAVQDDAVARFMQGFYERLRAAMPAARALRQTQLETLRTHPHPHSWAAFVLHGGW